MDIDTDTDVEKEINNLIKMGVTLNDIEKWYLLTSTSKKQNKIESVKTDEDIKIKLKANFPKSEYREIDKIENLIIDFMLTFQVHFQKRTD